MKNRQEEDILRLAFGDVSGPEAEQIRKVVENDPEAGKLFASYRGLSEGLRRMPVPEHQLSTERLRNAILDRNLKPHREGSFWRFLWVPAAVGAGAYLFATTFLGGANTPAFTDHGPSIDTVPYSTDAVPPTVGFPKEPAPSIVAEAPPSVGGTPVRSAKRHGGSRSSETGSVAVNTVPAGAENAFDGRGPGFRGGNVRKGREEVIAAEEAKDTLASNVETAIAENALALSAAPAAASSIVIIGSETDSMTGANKATEVSTVNNVVIGG